MKYNSQRFIFLTVAAFFIYNLVGLWNQVTSDKFNMIKFIALLLLAIGLGLIVISYLRVILKQIKK